MQNNFDDELYDDIIKFCVNKKHERDEYFYKEKRNEFFDKPQNNSLNVDMKIMERYYNFWKKLKKK